MFILWYHSIELGEEPLVNTAASLFRQICYEYRDSLVAGIICAGWDKKKGGQVINCFIMHKTEHF